MTEITIFYVSVAMVLTGLLFPLLRRFLTEGPAVTIGAVASSLASVAVTYMLIMVS